MHFNRKCHIEISNLNIITTNFFLRWQWLCFSTCEYAIYNYNCGEMVFWYVTENKKSYPFANENIFVKSLKFSIGVRARINFHRHTYWFTFLASAVVVFFFRFVCHQITGCLALLILKNTIIYKLYASVQHKCVLTAMVIFASNISIVHHAMRCDSIKKKFERVNKKEKNTQRRAVSECIGRVLFRMMYFVKVTHLLDDIVRSTRLMWCPMEVILFTYRKLKVK